MIINPWPPVALHCLAVSLSTFAIAKFTGKRHVSVACGFICSVLAGFAWRYIDEMDSTVWLAMILEPLIDLVRLHANSGGFIFDVVFAWCIPLGLAYFAVYLASVIRFRIPRYSIRTLLLITALLAIALSLLSGHLRAKYSSWHARAIERELRCSEVAAARNIVKHGGSFFCHEGRPLFVCLEDTKINSDTIKQLHKLGCLEMLDLSGTNIVDSQLSLLHDLPTVKYLGLSRSNISDIGILDLASLTGLLHIGLEQTGVTKQGVEQLQKALPDADIYWDEHPGNPNRIRIIE